MNRREFLLLSNNSTSTASLSCEQLYMRYVDSIRDGTTSQFFSSVEQSLSSVNALLLTDPAWLECEELRPMQSILTAFRDRGGRIEYRNQFAAG
jgi:hypothetical protein